KANKRILIVDDDPEIRRLYQTVLLPDSTGDVIAKSAGLFGEHTKHPVSAVKTHYALTLAANGEEGVRAVESALKQRQPFAAAFIDMQMPGINGAETSKRIWEIDPNLKIMIVTAYSEHSPDDIIRQVGRDDLFYIRKPFKLKEIQQFARALTSQWNLEREKEELFAALQKTNTELTVKTEQLTDSLKKTENANLRFHDANLARTRFLSLINHELRTPLNGILGFTDLLRGQFFGPLNEKQLDYINQVDSSGKRLLSLITDILDVVKIDAGELELEIGEVSARDAIHSITAIMSDQFMKKNIELTTSIEPALPPVIADLKKFRQIMLNLLSNAVKYTPEGGRVEIRAARDNDSKIRIEVSDSGVGIYDNDIEHIFDKFYQSDYAYDKQLGGVGIGLALTRCLVEIHGGSIGVESEHGKGSTFGFTLPLKEVQEQQEGTQQDEGSGTVAKEQHGHRILVAEDNETNLMLLLDMLSIQKHTVLVAKNGREAIELAQKHKPELFLMDMRMPVMDGLESTRRLRAMPEFAKVPIIALTASIGTDAEERQMIAGCTEHLPKPIQTKKLFEVLGKYLK
ncbi:response regulator, partial [Desulfococcaceae bacterium HSG7]|nr:response regulator [Desulfococcaceae bacterium HSG7]